MKGYLKFINDRWRIFELILFEQKLLGSQVGSWLQGWLWLAASLGTAINRSVGTKAVRSIKLFRIIFFIGF